MTRRFGYGWLIAIGIWMLIGYAAGQLIRGKDYGPVGNVALGLGGSIVLGIIGEEAAVQVAMKTEAAQRALNGGEPRRVIFIPSRNGQEPKVNIVV